MQPLPPPDVDYRGIIFDSTMLPIAVWFRGDCAPNCAGGIEATLSGVYPYAGLKLTERVWVWAAAGHGSREATMTPEMPESASETGMKADLTMSMGAVSGCGAMC